MDHCRKFLGPAQDVSLRPDGLAVVTTSIDVRGGKPTDKTADPLLHFEAGKLVAHWWCLGAASTFNGKPFNWCVCQTEVSPGHAFQGDLRILLAKDMVRLGYRGLPLHLAVIEGQAVVAGELDRDRLITIGTAFHAWNDDPRPSVLSHTFHLADGRSITREVQVRILVNNALTGYTLELQLQAERARAKPVAEVRVATKEEAEDAAPPQPSP